MLILSLSPSILIGRQSQEIYRGAKHGSESVAKRQRLIYVYRDAGSTVPPSSAVQSQSKTDDFMLFSTRKAMEILFHPCSTHNLSGALTAKTSVQVCVCANNVKLIRVLWRCSWVRAEVENSATSAFERNNLYDAMRCAAPHALQFKDTWPASGPDLRSRAPCLFV
jgi:hypothetical protein